jgi:hypothetical protein
VLKDHYILDFLDLKDYYSSGTSKIPSVFDHQIFPAQFRKQAMTAA